MLDVLLFVGVMTLVFSVLGLLWSLIPFRQISKETRAYWRKRCAITLPAAFIFCSLIGALMPDDKQTPQAQGCNAAVPTVEAVRAQLTDELSGDTKIDSIAVESPNLRLSINSGEWFSISAAGMRVHIGEKVMEPLQKLAACFPALENFRVEIMTPAAERRDEYGNKLPNGEALVCAMTIPVEKLRRYPSDFDWSSFGIYAANQYVTLVNVNMRSLWDDEVASETKLGGFTPTVQ